MESAFSTANSPPPPYNRPTYAGGGRKRAPTPLAGAVARAGLGLGWSRDALHYYYNFPTSTSKPNPVILYAACARRNSSAAGGLSGCCVRGAKTGRTEFAGVGEADWAMRFVDMGLGSDPFGTHSNQSTSRFSTRVKKLEVLWLLWTEKESWPAWIFHPKF